MANMFTKMMRGAVIGAATTTIAKALGLDDSLVGKVITTGTAMMSFMLADDPKLTDLFFQDSKKRKKSKKKGIMPGKKEAEDDFFGVFGDKGHKMNKAIAEETGATEDEVNSIMGLFLPTFEDAVIDKSGAEDEKSMFNFFGNTKKKAEKEAKKDPSLARMMTKMIF